MPVLSTKMLWLWLGSIGYIYIDWSFLCKSSHLKISKPVCSNENVESFYDEVQPKVKLSLWMPWRHKGSGGIALLILSHGGRWRLVISFMLWLLNSQRAPSMILNKGLGGPWSLSVCFGKEKSFLPPLGVEPQFFNIIAYSMLVSDVWLT
jgi:hypothetical protein